MGKRIISQARGKGSLTYRVRGKAFRRRIKYPMHEGEAEVLKIVHSPAHSAPLLKIKIADEVFYNAAFNGAVEGQKLFIGGDKVEPGNIMSLKNTPVTTKIFNIERNPGDGGKMIRTSGSNATVYKKYDHGKIGVVMPNKKEVKLDEKCRVTVGIIAGDGRKQKPFIKAGRKYYKMKAKSKLYPRVSGVSVNAIDHPFGSGRGKNVGNKTAKRNAPPGAKVGNIRPKRTGRKKR
jgi:large subunit ribosomal protein L2